MPRYTYECIGMDQSSPCGYVDGEVFFHCDDPKPRILEDARCPHCSGFLRRDAGADARTVGMQTDSIPGGIAISALPEPIGADTSRAGPGEIAKFYSKSQIERTIKAHNEANSDRPMRQIHATDGRKLLEKHGVTREHAQAINAGGRAAEAAISDVARHAPGAQRTRAKRLGDGLEKVTKEQIAEMVPA
jgi:hypothetical protein